MTSFVARNIDPAAANAIHDDDVARSLGFAGALVPGVELFGRTCTALGVPSRLALRFRRPVYDGERVDVEVGDDGALALRGPDGQVRAVGTVGGGTPALPDLVRADLPAVLPPPELASLPVGPLGTVEDDVDAARQAAYGAAVGEDVDVAGLHPGLLLRAVNLVLMRNVALGPWIHTGSDVALLAPVPLPARLQVRAAVRALTTSRAGHDVVRYDAVVHADGVPVAVVDHTAAYRLRT